MDLHFIWKSIVIVIGGVLVLRIAGRKSISQLTVAQTVMMVGVGSLIIQPVGDRNIWITMIITALLVLNLIIIEFLVLKYDFFEKVFYGRSIIVVENGQLQEKNLAKLRLTVDMLEVRLRQQGIQRISDIEWATIESNGQLGYMLKSDKQYATKEDIKFLIALIEGKESSASNSNSGNSDNIFKEIKKTNNHEKDIPDDLK
ncbi:DUF421 domain-containing protein [Litchfieldia alkalitelluris]|uniref:DUF421 domain-containing protein n=1 Tax=Litchfieldia alkalitelluris TaxID=304268 RepID=UPI000998B7A6|nr:DUF421 domain-containing protein [Litchfieldia alkalitelluris]